MLFGWLSVSCYVFLYRAWHRGLRLLFSSVFFMFVSCRSVNFKRLFYLFTLRAILHTMAMGLLIELHLTLLIFNVWVNSSPYSMAGRAVDLIMIKNEKIQKLMRQDILEPKISGCVTLLDCR